MHATCGPPTSAIYNFPPHLQGPCSWSELEKAGLPEDTMANQRSKYKKHATQVHNTPAESLPWLVLRGGRTPSGKAGYTRISSANTMMHPQVGGSFSSPGGSGGPDPAADGVPVDVTRSRVITESKVVSSVGLAGCHHFHRSFLSSLHLSLRKSATGSMRRTRR